jgi:hypothetical protein
MALALLTALSGGGALAQGSPGADPPRPGAILYREEFENLERWTHERFPKIEKASSYRIAVVDGAPALAASADASASYLLFSQVYSLRQYPLLRWRWRVDGVYAKEGEQKAVDDFPLRIFLLFEFEPEKASIMDRLSYGLAKSIYGAYPPHSSLSYVWDSRGASGRILISPYTDKDRDFVLRSGTALTGLWLDESVNVLEDYRKAFGQEPPDRVTLAIMADADDTGESASSYLRYIEIGAP